MAKASQQVCILTGEASGDTHGAQLATQLQQHGITCFGMGGCRMRAAGVDIRIDHSGLGVVGLVEVLNQLPSIYRIYRKICHMLTVTKPDLLILIDYPGLNLRIAQAAHKMGIKTLFYISPQIWAWRASRIHTIQRCVDHMAVILPFEVDIYRKAGVPVTFVGNPITEQVQITKTREDFKTEHQIPLDAPLLCLMPGSRQQEIVRLLPILCKTALLLQKTYPKLHCLLPIASSLSKTALQPYLRKPPRNLHCISNDTYHAIHAADAVITASGTATLEIALLGTPMVVVYKMALLTYCIARCVVRTPHIALSNIIAEDRLSPELLQNEVTPERIASHIKPLLSDTAHRQQTITQLHTLQQRLQHQKTGKNSDTLVELVLRMLAGPKRCRVTE